MKKQIKILLSASVVAPLLLFGTVAAVENGNKTGDQTTSNTQNSNEPKTTAASDAVKTDQLKQRLDERKAKLRTRLTNVEKQRLQSRCQKAQGTLISVSNRQGSAETRRSETYGALIARLSTLQNRLKNQDLDVTKLQQGIDGLKAKTDTFKTDFTTYKQALADLAAMDCRADPEGFKASLETARSAHATLKQDAAAIKVHINEVIKPTLQELRGQLENSKTNGSTTATEEN